MTIIELVIAISIMATMTSICIMKYNDDNYQVDSFVRQLCSDIRYVRRENMLNNKNVYISFDKDNKRWFYILQKNKNEDKRVFLPKKFNLVYVVNGKQSFIKFTDSGAPVNSGKITINKNNEYREITIVPTSGRILYKEGRYEKR